MPTPDDIRAYHALRGRFLSELWDAEGRPNPRAPWISAPDVLTAVGADRLPSNAVARLLRDLVEDDLVQPRLDDEQYSRDLRLTTRGRLEVERWVVSDEPSEHLHLPYSQTFATPAPAEVSRPAVDGEATDTRAHRQEALGEDLTRLIGLAGELLQDAAPAGRTREAIEADIEVLQKQHADLSSRPPRIRSALSRLAIWAGEAPALGASAILSARVEELARHVIDQL